LNEIELIRMFVPGKKILNDNRGEHYKIHTSKMQWFTNQTELMVEGSILGPCNFKCPDIKFVNNLIDAKNFGLRLEHWKCQHKFDLCNYEKSFKAIIDILIKNEYLYDDCWKYCHPIIFEGGDYSVWNRAFRYDKDNLPNRLTKSLWYDNGMDPKQDAILRIIAFSR
jgi:hypothetical protein